MKLIIGTYKAGSTFCGLPSRKPEAVLNCDGRLAILSTAKQDEILDAAIKLGFRGKIVLF